jgi:hypothetical protein
MCTGMLYGRVSSAPSVSCGNFTTMESQRVQLLNLLGSICCAPTPKCSDRFETLLLLIFILLV